VGQLEAQGLVVRSGTLIDVEPLERHWFDRQWRGVILQAAKTDGEADWCVYAGSRRTPVKGYKAHVAADEDGGNVRRVIVTPGSVHDSRGFEPVLPARPGRVWADRATTATLSTLRCVRGAGCRGSCGR
jgi:hypothetical protein